MLPGNLGYLAIGLRHLSAKKKSGLSTLTWIAIGGVTLGVAALLCVLAITSGFQREFQSKVLGVNSHLLVMKYGLDFSEYPDVMRRIGRKEGVVATAPFVVTEMMAVKDSKLAAVLLKGIDPKQSLRVLDLPSQITAGTIEGLASHVTALKDNSIGTKQGGNRSSEESLATLLDRMGIASESTERPKRDQSESVPTPSEASASLKTAKKATLTLPSDDEEARLLEHGALTSQDPSLHGIVLGVELAEKLQAKVGDVVQIVSPLPGLFANGAQSSHFRVTGIFEAGFQEYDSRLAYVSLDDAQRFIGEGDTVTGIEVRMHDVDDAPPLARKLEKELGVSSPYHVVDWRQLNHNLFTALEIQKIMLTLVIATIVVVAAFNVIATLIMVVLEKRRDIAILKAMGAKDLGILSVFLIQGVVVGCIGIALGLLIGGGLLAYLSHIRIPLDPKIYLINHLPVLVDRDNYFVTSAVAFVICTLSTLFPSLWAARMLPVEGLK